MRKNVYDLAKLCQNDIKELQDDSNYFYNLSLFYENIKQGKYKQSLIGHKLLIETEQYMLDEIVFNAEKHNYNSENVRKGCKNVKVNNKNRKFVLKKAMICDATIGYWKLSK